METILESLIGRFKEPGIAKEILELKFEMEDIDETSAKNSFIVPDLVNLNLSHCKKKLIQAIGRREYRSLSDKIKCFMLLYTAMTLVPDTIMETSEIIFGEDDPDFFCKCSTEKGLARKKIPMKTNKKQTGTKFKLKIEKVDGQDSFYFTMRVGANFSSVRQLGLDYLTIKEMTRNFTIFTGFIQIFYDTFYSDELFILDEFCDESLYGSSLRIRRGLSVRQEGRLRKKIETPFNKFLDYVIHKYSQNVRELECGCCSSDDGSVLYGPRRLF